MQRHVIADDLVDAEEHEAAPRFLAARAAAEIPHGRIVEGNESGRGLQRFRRLGAR
jgi:hypothetical protein